MRDGVFRCFRLRFVLVGVEQKQTEVCNMGAFCRGTGWILAALPCPYGQGALQGCGAALPAPAGQERFVWARARFWGFRGLDGGRNAAACKLPSGARGAGGAARIFCPSARFPVPAGLRRALPAPAQGTRPLRIPFAAAQTPRPRSSFTKAGRPLLVGRPAGFALSPIRNAT